MKPAGPLPGRRVDLSSGGNEFIPLLHHVPVFVYDGVPARHVAHAFPEGAAVAHVTGVLHVVAVRILDLALGRLAFIPVVPLVLAHELLGGFGNRAVVALLGDEAALPSGLVPVEILVSRVELEAA